MQDLFIEFLPPWVETGLQPAFYDRESGTVLQQTARMYAKVNELVKAVNGMDKVIKEYVDYIDNYFKNLDVQEEINNKLDEMAEGGELAEFIALYANLPCVHAYATIAEMASSENLADGSYARAMSKTVAGTGDGAYYKIREAVEGDDPDGENLVAITGTTLVAEIIPDFNLESAVSTLNAKIAEKLPHYIVPTTATADDVQALIDIEGDKIIEFEKGETYTFSKALHLTSGTTLELNGATLFFDFIDSTDETLGIYNYKFTDTSTGYNGSQNVAINNGYIKQGCVVLMHGNNTLLENVEFISMYCRHCIQIAGCRDTQIKNCAFHGVYKDDTIAEGSECINIDPTIYGAQPYMDAGSVMYDNTPNIGIYVDGCSFMDASDEYHKFYVAFGSHYSYDDMHIYNYDIRIKDCWFGTPNYWAICLRSMEGVLIDNNQLYGDSTYSRDDGSYFIITRAGNNKIKVSNNIVKGIEQFYHVGSPLAINNNITIDGNFSDTEDNTSNDPAIWLYTANKVAITNNTLRGDGVLIGYRGNSDTSTVANDFLLANNTLINTADSFVAMIDYASNIVVENNSFANATGALTALLYIANTTNINGVRNNKIQNKQKFVNDIANVNQNFANNGAMYQQMDWDAEGSTSKSGNFWKNISNFRKLFLQLGTGSNSEVIVLDPWFYNGNYMDDRTYKFPVVNNDNSAGYGTFTISNSGASFSYSGSLPIRGMWGSDT